MRIRSPLLHVDVKAFTAILFPDEKPSALSSNFEGWFSFWHETKAIALAITSPRTETGGGQLLKFE
jgi:hypothetical protein